MTPYRPSSLRTGGRKRIFILFFCVIPPNQYPPSGFAGHLLINKEAYPIPILPVRIPFLNTVANPLLALWMTPYRLRSFWTEARMLCRKDGKRNNESEWRIYVSDDILPLFLITVIDPSHSFRMTSFVLHHYDASRSPLLVTSFPPIVILNRGKHAVWEKQETGWWHWVKNLLCWWHLTAFLTTVIDPSHSFRMTFNVSLIMKPYRISSFRAEVRMLYEKTGRRLCDTERRIYYPRWRLTFPSLQQQILCWYFVWHLMEIICFGF